ncbi:MAG: hypothetical protein HKUEN01_15410 [Candidatus Kuenenia stuttgartiensis]|jgi:hypothetical protein|nr:MAG: hypothetical protein HKUEN01_15410 [Candidatus Kuenenia stuttgartiensis]
MPKLTPTSYNELVKKLRMFGFEGPYGGGKHLYYGKGQFKTNNSKSSQERNKY